MNVKIEQELNFVVDDSRLFLDTQEAKKVSERSGLLRQPQLMIVQRRLYSALITNYYQLHDCEYH